MPGPGPRSYRVRLRWRNLDRSVGQLVAVGCGVRRMRRQKLADRGEGDDETVDQLTASHRCAEAGDHRFPARGTGARVDAGIGDDLDMALGERDEEQQTGARRGAALDAGSELQPGQLARMRALDPAGDEKATQTRPFQHEN